MPPPKSLGTESGNLQPPADAGPWTWSRPPLSLSLSFSSHSSSPHLQLQQLRLPSLAASSPLTFLFPSPPFALLRSLSSFLFVSSTSNSSCRLPSGALNAFVQLAKASHFGSSLLADSLLGSLEVRPLDALDFHFQAFLLIFQKGIEVHLEFDLFAN